MVENRHPGAPFERGEIVAIDQARHRHQLMTAQTIEVIVMSADQLETRPMANALEQKIAAGELVTLMAAHNPLSARLAEEAGFDGIWASGFELSAAYGLPDASLLSFTQHLDMTRAVIEQIGVPLVAD